MRYEADQSAIRDKQNELQKAQDDIAIAKLEKQKQLIQDTIDLLNKQKEALQEAMEESSKHYDKLIKEQTKMFDNMTKEIDKIIKKWSELAELDEISKAWGLVSDEMESLGFTVQDVLNDTPGAFEAFKDKYIEVLTEMHKGDQGYLDGLKETAGKIGETSKSATEAKEPIAELGTESDKAATKVASLGTSASNASTGVGKLKDKSERISENFDELNKVSLDNLVNTELENLRKKLDEVKDLINGPNSIKSAFDSLGQAKLDNLANSFTGLSTAIGSAASALGVGTQMPTAGISSLISPKATISSGDGLTSAIEGIKTAATDNIGTSPTEEGTKAIGSFVALKDAIDNVAQVMGSEDATEAETLTSSVSSLKTVAEKSLSEEGGVISMFEDLESKIKEILSAAKELIETLQTLSNVDLPNFEGLDINNFSLFKFGKFAGTAHYQGTAKLNGDWGVKRNETALVGELGQELVVSSDGKYRTVGDNGPELTKLNRGDIVFNAAQTEEILSKKNQIKGPAHAAGTLPNGYSPIADNSAISTLKSRIREMGLPTLDGIKQVLQAQTDAIKTEIHNVANTANTTVNQHNTFNISGVSGEDVARQINTTLVETFSGMSLNAYQRSLT